ncbi:MAG: carbonic anhydrase [Mogibacterium sp.]|nr:carbonic anhydrase [Mogibacterium sp.]
MLTADEAKQRLIDGNKSYLGALTGDGDISPAKRRETALNGQNPYAIVITCSDSRVIPESIFSAGIGELFVIRVAGNVLDDHQLGSIEYAADHLGTKLIVLLGHTRCGAVGAAIEGHTGGFIESILKDIQLAIGNEKDDFKASCLNVKHGVETIRRELKIHPIHDPEGLRVAGAIYHIEDGRVEFLTD